MRGEPGELVGATFGELTVLASAGVRGKQPKRYWICRCACGVTKEVRGASLTCGLVKTCGHGRGRKRQSDVKIGARFGILTIQSVPAPYGGKVHCICDCGTLATVRMTNLRSGNTKSCGCLRASTQFNRAAETVT